jgi:hypothetical protein
LPRSSAIIGALTWIGFNFLFSDCLKYLLQCCAREGLEGTTLRHVARHLYDTKGFQAVARELGI